MTRPRRQASCRACRTCGRGPRHRGPAAPAVPDTSPARACNTAIVYAALQTGGVMRSRDGGATFEIINTGLTSLRTSRGNGVVIDPTDFAVIYIGTEGGGVFKSTDSGGTWRAVSQGLSNPTVFALAIDPHDRSVLYAGGGSGVFRTVTAGEPR